MVKILKISYDGTHDLNPYTKGERQKARFQSCGLSFLNPGSCFQFPSIISKIMCSEGYRPHVLYFVRFSVCVSRSFSLIPWRSEESAYIKCYRAVYNRSTTGLNTDARKNVASAALAATHNAPQATELAPNSRGGTRGGWHITHRQTCNTAQ